MIATTDTRTSVRDRRAGFDQAVARGHATVAMRRTARLIRTRQRTMVPVTPEQIAFAETVEAMVAS